MAINEDGWVYVFDNNATYAPGGYDKRLMVFEPVAGSDYEEYEYAGEVAGGGFGEGNNPQRPVTDEEGNLYVGGAPTSNSIRRPKRSPPARYPHHSTPSCSFLYKKGGVETMTVDPASGEPYFTTYKTPEYVHELGPCEAGKFSETGTVKIDPAIGDEEGLSALVFDPDRRAAPARPPGVLYGAIAAAAAEPPGYSSLGYVFAGPAGPSQTLTVSKSGSGAGTVTSDPEGIDCGGECEVAFEAGEAVTLTATAGEGSEFSGWSGECDSVSGDECEVTMSAARAVTASFEEEGGGTPEYPLTTHVTGEGSIECAPPGGGFEAEYPQGTLLTLTAVPNEGWEFKEWTGACAGTLLPVCEVTIEEATEVGGVFEQVLHKLTVSVSGEGEVSADSGAISGCTQAGGAVCEGEYPEGSTVTLTETPEEGSHFTGWGTPQCDESTEPTCEVTIGSGDEAVAASFEAEAGGAAANAQHRRRRRDRGLRPRGDRLHRRSGRLLLDRNDRRRHGHPDRLPGARLPVQELAPLRPQGRRIRRRRPPVHDRPRRSQGSRREVRQGRLPGDLKGRGLGPRPRQDQARRHLLRLHLRLVRSPVLRRRDRAGDRQAEQGHERGRMDQRRGDLHRQGRSGRKRMRSADGDRARTGGQVRIAEPSPNLPRCNQAARTALFPPGPLAL
jgi:hypothetical protein